MIDIEGESMDLSVAHERNLKIKMLKIYVTQNDVFFKKGFSEQQIHTQLYFRQMDMRDYRNLFFEKKDDLYYLKRDWLNILNKWKYKHVSVDETYKNTSEKFLKKFEAFMDDNQLKVYDKTVFSHFFENIKTEINILHWGSLPVYKDSVLCEYETIPEENLELYYNDFSALNDLYNWIRNMEYWKPSFYGDCNLNIDMKFSVYSRRWGHRDTYYIQRTIDGWLVTFMGERKKAEKDGCGALINNMKHDYIFFPEDDFKDAMSTLWNMADEREMSSGELADKLQNIADWISAIEVAVGKNRPTWL